MLHITVLPRTVRFHGQWSLRTPRWSFVQLRGAKILRWSADTPHSRAMEKLNHFDDLLNYCLDNKDSLGKRDMIASLSYMRSLRNFNLSSPQMRAYSDFICSNLSIFGSSIHLVIHRFAVLGYNPALLRIYEEYLKGNLEDLSIKQLCLISWSYAKSNIYVQELFERIGIVLRVIQHVLTAASYFHRPEDGCLTDASLLLWSFAKIERRVPHEISALRGIVFHTLESLVSALRDPDAALDNTARLYLDVDRTFYGNVTHDLCMSAKALAVLVPRDKRSLQHHLELLLEVSRLGKLPLSAQGITSLWESMCLGGIIEGSIVDELCEVSRYLRLDHSFNSNMLCVILSSIRALGVHDPRIIYQIVHWLEKRAVQMHAPQMYSVICHLDAMGVYHEKAWKQLGVVVQKKGIDLDLRDIRHLYSIFKSNGKGNDRIFGILEHFMSCKEDQGRYDCSCTTPAMSAVLLRALKASDKPLPQSAQSWLHQTSTVAFELDDGYILVDHYGEKGVRKTMEDECVVVPSLRKLNPDLPSSYDFLVCGLFDGHGGRSCASFAKENLLNEVIQQLLQHLQSEVSESDEFSESVFRKSVNAACLRLDSRIAHDLIGCNDGCTALLLFVGRRLIYVVNLGDSAAYLCRRLNNVLHAVPLNEVHKAWIPKEKERILHYGGTVEGGRVNGVLEVTRSFGDLGLKRFGVKCTGSFRQASLDFDNDEIILLACDGFWNVYDPHEACRTALRFLRQDEIRANSDPQLPFLNLRKVCKDLVENALTAKRAQDNVSVVLLRLVRKSEEH
ncbi:putative protein phosphatase 2C 8 [Babesia sp. Xinjiang]|uniref:putative protein phosphatase 2C 8 n=1 Tax=Babesia sp. Xinjiang TaxID=462227 RepID=UPI000A2498D8|nr:putative protein phosphatase 2C 8 [Babesia sp. Xinjiang]ORM40474.1 putative protein phosphatase 2C 8 [Babesia sp. Xinjiang]